jgi:hypothetical protein
MFQLPNVPFTEIETFVASTFVIALGCIHLWKTFRSELKSKKCVFCGEMTPADEYTHHLEICGLKNWRPK